MSENAAENPWEKATNESTMISEVSISGVQYFAPKGPEAQERV